MTCFRRDRERKVPMQSKSHVTEISVACKLLTCNWEFWDFRPHIKKKYIIANFND